MKTFLEEYGIIIVSSIVILALVTLAVTASGTLSEQVSTLIKSFTDNVAVF